MGIFDRFPTTKLNDINLDWILKVISKFKGGNAGQFLRKRTDANFDFYWSNAGGGGTTDYNDLVNQPQINNVTLVGNMSASDLGLLDSSALVPYRTAAAQDTIDAAKQAKITASGMLKGDGDGGVTAATEGTDYLGPSALNSYRTAAAQDTIDAAKQAKITASGMLKGDGNGGVSAATAGVDYATPRTLLWTNPSTLYFGAENITLSSSDYDVLEVVFKTTNDANGPRFSQFFAKGYDLQLFVAFATTNQPSNTFIMSRAITRNTDISFTSALGVIARWGSTTGGDTGYDYFCYPIMIYGHKY